MATIGATRPSPDYSRWIHDLCDPGQYGPFVYSREDIREVVEYAASLHITVLPEIEFPAHSREVLMAYPEFFCSDALHLREAITMCNADGAPLKFGAEPALNKSALCVGNDATLAFARHLIDVVCELVPGDVEPQRGGYRGDVPSVQLGERTSRPFILTERDAPSPWKIPQFHNSQNPPGTVPGGSGFLAGKWRDLETT